MIHSLDAATEVYVISCRTAKVTLMIVDRCVRRSGGGLSPLCFDRRSVTLLSKRK
jgi:hypothetical protein